MYNLKVFINYLKLAVPISSDQDTESPKVVDPILPSL